jgi:hypothetical protein
MRSNLAILRHASEGAARDEETLVQQARGDPQAANPNLADIGGPLR